MEYLFEFLLDLILETGIEVSSNKKISKMIRYPLILLIVLFFALVIFGLLFLGILILNKNIWAGIFIISVSAILLISAIIKFKKIYINKLK